MVEGKTANRSPAAERALVVLGFGLFMVTYGGGPFGFVSGSAQHSMGWQPMLLVQTAFFLGAVLGFACMRILIRRDAREPFGIAGTAGYVAVVLLGLIAQPLLDGIDGEAGVVVRATLSCAAGMFYAPPLAAWVGSIFSLSKTSSHYGLLGMLIPCYLICPLVVTLCSALDSLPYVFSIALLLCAVGSSLIQVLCLRPVSGPSSRQQADRPYRLTPHSASLLICLGFSWGICDAASILVLESTSTTSSSMVVAFVLILVTAIAIWMSRGRRDVRFGTIVRLSVVACGAVLVALPLLFTAAPSLLYPLCNLAMIVGEVALVVFTVDICSEEGRPVAPTFALNFTVLMGTSVVSALIFFAVHTLADGQAAWLVTSVVAVWVVLAVIPFLPSRSSGAIVLTSATLPENEGYEANVALKRERMAQRYALSAGESAVLDRLIQGKKREEIADEMGLSPWTVKARTSSVYKKCGVHSYKELVQLISADQ